MEATRNRLKFTSILILTVFAFSGCSKDHPDYYCDYNFIITISPEGSGSVSECPKCGPTEIELRYTKFTAIPNEGYVFKEWILEDGRTNTINPLPYLSYWCDEKGATIRITAVFEEVNE